MTKVKMSVRQIIDLGLWESVCDYKGWNYYIINEGMISENEIVEFDSQFKKSEKKREPSVNTNTHLKCSDDATKEKLRRVLCMIGLHKYKFMKRVVFLGTDYGYSCIRCGRYGKRK